MYKICLSNYALFIFFGCCSLSSFPLTHLYLSVKMCQVATHTRGNCSVLSVNDLSLSFPFFTFLSLFPCSSQPLSLSILKSR